MLEADARASDFDDARADDDLARPERDLAPVVDRGVDDDVRPRVEVADRRAQRVVAGLVAVDVVRRVVQVAERVEVRPAGRDAELEFDAVNVYRDLYRYSSDWIASRNDPQRPARPASVTVIVDSEAGVQRPCIRWHSSARPFRTTAYEHM